MWTIGFPLLIVFATTFQAIDSVRKILTADMIEDMDMEEDTEDSLNNQGSSVSQSAMKIDAGAVVPMDAPIRFTSNMSVSSVASADEGIKRDLHMQAYMSSLPCIKQSFAQSCDEVIYKVPTPLRSMFPDGLLGSGGAVRVTPELLWQWRMYDEMKELLTPATVVAMRGNVPGLFTQFQRAAAWLDQKSISLSDVLIHNMYETMLYAFMQSNCHQDSIASEGDAVATFDDIVSQCMGDASEQIERALGMHVDDLNAATCPSEGLNCLKTIERQEVGSLCMEGMECANVRVKRRPIQFALGAIYAAYWYFTPAALLHLPAAAASAWCVFPIGPINAALAIAVGSYASGCSCTMMECQWDTDRQLCAPAGKTSVDSLKEVWSVRSLVGMKTEPACSLQPCGLDDFKKERMGAHDHGVYNCKNWGATTKQARFEYYDEHPARGA